MIKSTRARRLYERYSQVRRKSISRRFNHNLAVAAAADNERSIRLSMPPSLGENHQNEVAPFNRDEILLGPKLGEGEFSDVYEIQSFCLQQRDVSKDIIWTIEESEKRLHMKKMEKYRQSHKNRYALKRIKRDFLPANGREAYLEAVSDLALEAEILQHLNHPHIIKLRGLTHSGVSGFAHGPNGFFLVLDRLYEILDQRIKRWHDPSGGPTLPPNRFVEEGHELIDECLTVALQISAAMEYLHSHSIIFRDLKPANIGFDVRGDVKIFDFGLARIMPKGGCPYSDTFEMSGAFTPRYASPECLGNTLYNMKADVYSFAIVMWEMLSGETPYSFVKSRDHLIDHVVEECGRPEIDESWPRDIQTMLKNSFDPNTENRPTMAGNHTAIRLSLESLRGGNSEQLSNSYINHRRTALSITDALLHDSQTTTSLGSFGE